MRTGKRGENRWKSITWNEAIRILQERLQKLRRKGEPHRIAFLDGGTKGTMRALIAQFMRAYGSPNYIHQDGTEPAQLAFQLTQGGNEPIAYDLPNSLFVLNFGFDLLEAEGAPVWQTMSYGKLRSIRHMERVELVHVEPRMSITATNADKWIPIRPGSEAALALGIAHILIQENTYNREFIQKYTFGFEDWTDASKTSHIGFKTLALRGLNLWARLVPLNPLADFEPDRVAQQGLRQPSLGRSGAWPLASNCVGAFLEQLEKGEPYSLDTLLIYEANPLFSSPDIEKVKWE